MRVRRVHVFENEAIGFKTRLVEVPCCVRSLLRLVSANSVWLMADRRSLKRQASNIGQARLEEALRIVRGMDVCYLC